VVTSNKKFQKNLDELVGMLSKKEGASIQDLQDAFGLNMRTAYRWLEYLSARYTLMSFKKQGKKIFTIKAC
jgi:transposase